MIELIPNWHPVWVHFAVALLIVGALSYLVARARKATGAGAGHALILARWCVWIGVLMAGLALATGFWAAGSVAHDDPAHANMLVHRNWAIAATILFAAVAAIEWARHASHKASALSLVLALAGGVAIAVTGFEGGQNVYEHGLGVRRLPDVGGHDHAAHGHADAPSGGNDRGGHGHDEPADQAAAAAAGDAGGHDHGDHDHDQAPAATSEPAAGHDHGDHDHGAPAAAPPLPVETGPLADLADRLSAALAAKDRDAVFALLDPDVLIFESGNVESSRAEYEGHHMPSDMAFLAGVERELLSRQVVTVSNETAVVSSRYRMTGTFRDREVDTTTDETLVFENQDGQWRIVHIHWSNG